MRATLAGEVTTRCQHDEVVSFYRVTQATQWATCSRIAFDWLALRRTIGVYYGKTRKSRFFPLLWLDDT